MAPDPASVRSALLPNGAPTTPEQRAEFFELYKLMVESSEALVTRRQGVNTFFLTMNGVLLTAIGLFLKGGGRPALQAAGIAVLAFAGAALCFAWRSLIVSFGQLNTGKFRIINSMEATLSASVYAAEWVALGEGEDPKVYRSFTSREKLVPEVLGGIHFASAIVAGLIAFGVWDVASK